MSILLAQQKRARELALARLGCVLDFVVLPVQEYAYNKYGCARNRDRGQVKKHRGTGYGGASQEK